MNKYTTVIDDERGEILIIIDGFVIARASKEQSSDIEELLRLANRAEKKK